MKESAFYQYIINKGRTEGLTEGRTEGLAEGRTEGLVEGRTEGLAEGRTEGLIEGLLFLIKNRFTSVPRNISAKIKSIRDKKILLNIQKLAIDAKTKREFVEAFNALNI